MEANNEILKKKLLELLSKMDFEAEVYERQEEGRTVFNIKTKDAYLLIGKQGANLEALQHITRMIVKKDLPDFMFAIDIDDYKDKRVIYLKELARRAAHHVRANRKSVALEPMPSYERKIIHDYLSLYSDITSQSTGDEPRRRIIIKPGSNPAKKDDPFNFIENL